MKEKSPDERGIADLNKKSQFNGRNHEENSTPQKKGEIEKRRIIMRVESFHSEK